MRFPSRVGSTILQTMACSTLSPCSRPCSTSPMSELFWHSAGARLRRNCCSHFVTIGCAWRCKGSFLCVLVRSDVCYKLYYSTQDNHQSLLRVRTTPADVDYPLGGVGAQINNDGSTRETTAALLIREKPHIHQEDHFSIRSQGSICEMRLHFGPKHPPWPPRVCLTRNHPQLHHEMTYAGV